MQKINYDLLGTDLAQQVQETFEMIEKIKNQSKNISEPAPVLSGDGHFLNMEDSSKE